MFFSKPQKVVVTDLNGPWIKGDSTYRAICYLVGEKNLQPDWPLKQAASNMHQYEAGKITYGDAIAQIMSAYDNLTRGKPKKEIEQMLDELAQSGNVPLHPYCGELLMSFKNAGRRVIGVTSSPEEMTSHLRKYVLPMDEMISTPHPVDDAGKFTVIKEPLMTKERKAAVLAELKKRGDLDWTDSIGIGDTMTDMGIFDGTVIKVALNPDHELYRAVSTLAAKGEGGWHIAPNCMMLVENLLSPQAPKKP